MKSISSLGRPGWEGVGGLCHGLRDAQQYIFHQVVELVRENHNSLLHLPKFPLLCIEERCL